ncbi:UNVERIFIED_CONTAM: hypothetical protein Slati_2677700 [Sesamum latifolium]|uniref:GRF-type domain-containing protein n=1 Tax=Sesamum latifolium TaxID=2727402 RepID=A0AAW2VUL3_9LAMI
MDSNKGDSSHSSSGNSQSETFGSGRRRNSNTSGIGADAVCRCGYYVVTRTSWTTSNPGRRFRGCLESNGNYCRTFEWIDPPMCIRSLVVIPGLLKKLNGYEKKFEEVPVLRVELQAAYIVKRTLLFILALFLILFL